MKIAVAAYVDGIEQNKFADECNLMTYSGQCLDDRFTFVIYAHPDVVHLLDTYDNVRVVPYSIGEDPYYSTYRFARSLKFVHDFSEPLDEFDMVIKTDTDTMLSPAMNNFPFSHDKIHVGLGHYSVTPAAEQALKEAAIKFGYPSYSRVADMHSTIIAPRKDLIEAMELSDKLCREMYFGLEEPGEWGTERLWRGYHENNSGICSMYATEIVLSSDKYRERVVVSKQIDAGSDWWQSWRSVYHYHCYHHDFIYSKFQAKFGAYADLPLQTGSSSAAYCINKYIERRDAGRANPERFAKPEFTVFDLPDSYDGYTVKYNFDKEVWNG